MKSPDFQQRMLAIGAEPMTSTPKQFARRIQDETRKFAKLVKDGKVASE